MSLLDIMKNTIWQQFDWNEIPSEDLERYVREHLEDSSWRDLTIMMDHLSIDFIREFEDRFTWYSWPSPTVIRSKDRYKEFWWKYE